MEILVLLGGPTFSIEVSSLPPTKYGVVSSAAINDVDAILNDVEQGLGFLYS